jgi:CTP synthase (UTP-ammonia lyase)
MPERDLPVIALLGDESGHRSHQELNALRSVLADELDVAAEWVATDRPFDVRRYDGVWLVPGSPYASDASVLEALTVVRSEGIPFLGTCGGMQYAVMEFVRSVVGGPATHAESDGEGPDNVVSPLACSLYGEERTVVPVPGTRFASWVREPFPGMHFCNYAPTAEAIGLVEEHGVVVGATAEDAGAEVLEFPDHRFYVASMFQPHIGASAGGPVHPLVRAFVGAVRG